MKAHKKNYTHPKATGRRYSTIKELMEGEGISQEIQDNVVHLIEGTQLVTQLILCRTKAGLTQKDVAERIGVTQSAISKIENGIDDDLSIRHIKEYVKITGKRIGIGYGKPLTHVEAIKLYVLAVHDHLLELAKLAHRDQEIGNEIQDFFNEAQWNIFRILGKCYSELPKSNIIKSLQEEEVEILPHLLKKQNEGSKLKVTEHC